MSGMGRRRISRARAAELLSGRGSATPDPLSSVISAAAAPARSDELAGEDLAVAAFHRSRLSPAPTPARRRRLALVKVAGFVLAGLSLGGVAFAATGILPSRPSSPPPAPAPSTTSSGPGVTRTEGVAPKPSTSPSDSPTKRPQPAPKPLPTRPPEPTPEPEPLPTRTGRPRPWPVPTTWPVPTELPIPSPIPLPTRFPTTFPDFPGE